MANPPMFANPLPMFEKDDDILVLEVRAVFVAFLIERSNWLVSAVSLVLISAIIFSSSCIRDPYL